MVVELARDRLVGRLYDGVRLPLGQPSLARIDKGAGFLDVAVDVLDFLWHLVVAD